MDEETGSITCASSDGASLEESLRFVRAVWRSMENRRAEGGDRVTATARYNISRLVAGWDLVKNKTEVQIVVVRKQLEEIFADSPSYSQMRMLIAFISQGSLHALFCWSTGNESFLSDKTKNRIVRSVGDEDLLAQKVLLANCTTSATCCKFFAGLNEALMKVYFAVLEQNRGLAINVKCALGIPTGV